MKPIYQISLLLLIALSVGCKEDNNQVKNIEAFTKVYGYVRWFHPSDEAQTIDWNKFAAYGVSRVKEAKSSKALRDTILRLFKPIAPTLKISLEADYYEFDKNALIPEDTNINRCIAWQHFGVKLDDLGSETYKSIRTNRVNVDTKPNKYQIYYVIESEIFKYNNLRLSFNSKCNEGGKVNAFIAAGSKLSLFTKPELIHCTEFSNNSWRTNQISTYCGNNTIVMFGVSNRSDAEIFVDDFLLEVQTNSGWQVVKIDNADLNIVSEYNIPKGFLTKSDNLYHTSSVKRDSATNNFCLSIKPFVKNTMFDQYPNVGEVINKDLPRGLKLTMPVALYGNDETTYPIADKALLDKLKYSLSQPVSKTDKELGAIVITWNVFQHFYPYFNEVSVDWNRELINTISEYCQADNKESFVDILRKLTAKLNDGHIRVISEKDNRNNGYLPLTWERVENKLVVTSVLDKNVMIKTGDIITNINNTNAENFIDKEKKYISAATSGFLKNRSELYSLRRPLNTETTLTIINSNKEKSKIKIANTSNLSAIYRSNTNKTKFKRLGDSIFYINLSQVNMQEFNSLLPKLKQCKGIIFDLRRYPKCSPEFLSYLITQNDTVGNWMQIPKYIYPDQKDIVGYDKFGWNITPKEPQLKAPAVFLTRSNAISYCESILGIVKYYKLGLIVGENSAGTNGDVNIFSLTGGYKLYFTGMKVTKLDGTRFHGIGISPDYEVHKTIEGVRAGKDEFMEKAVDVIKYMQQN
ncbi:MAG: S41 family peptidase [Bacteroidales bacterium]|jgi:C-terminal processing protease CtpA/Prc|nr:S41 family peptidase [Bacteroidales bacterium]